MRKTLLSNEALCNAVNEMERGLIDADLGGGIIKKRLPLPGPYLPFPPVPWMER
jgi:hypothetical protein